MLMAAGALAGSAIAGSRIPQTQAQTPGDLSASVRIFESTTTHNSFPDECDMRLQKLYIAEGLQLSISVEFDRALSDEESQQVRWEVSNGAAQPASGDFVGQPNPALITTMLGGARDATVRVTYQGADLTDPLPMRIIADTEYDAAYAVLTGYTTRSSRLPLTSDLLARFLGMESSAVGAPSVGTYSLNICDPRLTHRAGADWGTETITDVPDIQYTSDQPAAAIVADGVAIAVLSSNASDIRQFFADNPVAATYAFNVRYSGNLTLDFPLDANFALHGVQFDGALSAVIDAPSGPHSPLTAHDVQVNGSVVDLYDFNLEASGPGALPATEAAKVEIASVKHGDIGKVFVVTISLDNAIDSVDFDPYTPRE
jgi:hypothetical protein